MPRVQDLTVTAAVLPVPVRDIRGPGPLLHEQHILQSNRPVGRVAPAKLKRISNSRAQHLSAELTITRTD
jgi:hypothetical protein